MLRREHALDVLIRSDGNTDGIFERFLMRIEHISRLLFGTCQRETAP